MKLCSECSEKVQNNARVCKHCGHRFTDEEMSAAAARANRNTVITVTISLLFVFFILKSCSDAPASAPLSSSSALSGSKSEPIEHVQILVKPWSWGMSASGNYCDGGGSITNTGDVTLRNLKLALQFFDRKDNLVASDSAYSEVAELSPGQRSTFKIFTRCPANVDKGSIAGATHRFGQNVTVTEK